MKLEQGNGKCLPTAFYNCLLNPSWLFCYAYFKIDDKTVFLHAWNENGSQVVDSENKICTDRESFYRVNGLKESEITKLNLKQLINCMHDQINLPKKNKNIWGWISLPK